LLKIELQFRTLIGEQTIQIVNAAEIKQVLGTRKPEPDNAGVGIELGTTSIVILPQTCAAQTMESVQ